MTPGWRQARRLQATAGTRSRAAGMAASCYAAALALLGRDPMQKKPQIARFGAISFASRSRCDYSAASFSFFSGRTFTFTLAGLAANH